MPVKKPKPFTALPNQKYSEILFKYCVPLSYSGKEATAPSRVKTVIVVHLLLSRETDQYIPILI